MANYLLHPPAHHHGVDAACAQSAGPFPASFRSGFALDPAALLRPAPAGGRQPAAVSSPASWRSSLLSFGLAPWLGQNFFPAVDAGPDQAARSRPDRHPHRGNCPACAIRSSSGSTRSFRERDLGDGRRQHRPAGQRHQHRLRQLRDHRTGRCRYLHHAETGPSSHAGSMSARCGSNLPRLFPGASFAFLPADIITQILNFRTAGADRRAGDRPRPGGQPRLCRQVAGRHPPRAGCRRPAHGAGVRPAVAERRTWIVHSPMRSA